MLKKSLSIVSIIVILILGISIGLLAISPSNINEDLKVDPDKLSDLEKVHVERVIDGDTFETTGGEDIRFIGVDTPETKHPEKGVEYYGKEASKYTTNQLEGKTVYLEYDTEKRDKYQRILAYVFLPDGTFFNAKLLHDGYANLLTIPPNVKYVNLFKELVKEAREIERGLWAKQEEKKTDLPVISWEEAGNYIGQGVIVEGMIVDTYDSGETIFLNFDEDYSETFTAVIFSSDEYKVDFEPEEYYLGKKVKVRGKVKEYEVAL